MAVSNPAGVVLVKPCLITGDLLPAMLPFFKASPLLLLLLSPCQDYDVVTKADDWDALQACCKDAAAAKVVVAACSSIPAVRPASLTPAPVPAAAPTPSKALEVSTAGSGCWGVKGGWHPGRLKISLVSGY